MILVALIVLVVPELLSGPSRRAAQPIAVAEDAPIRSVTVDLGDEPRAAPQGRPQPDELPATPKAAAAAPASSVATVSAEASQSPPAPVAPPIVVRPQPVSVPHSPPPDSAGWWVQVGSFESREHAETLVRRLRADGFAAFSSASAKHGRKWYRVRVGPARDRAAARALSVRLHAAGQETGSLVPP